MPRFAIKYSETYSKVYYVDADNYYKGVDKLQEAIEEGTVNGPDQCSDSAYMNVSDKQDDGALEDDRNLDIA